MTPPCDLRRHARRRHLALAVLVSVVAACGRRDDTPTSPTRPPAVDLSRGDAALELRPDRHFVQLTGLDLSEDPRRPPCSPLYVPHGGKFVTTFLWFSREGDELVGRSRPPYLATLEMRLRRVRSSLLGVEFEGTVTGAVPDEYDRIYGQRDTTFAAAGTVTLAGLVTPKIGDNPLAPAASGWMDGPMTFRDRAGSTGYCGAVHFFMEPNPPGGVHDDPTLPPFSPGQG